MPCPLPTTLRHFESQPLSTPTVHEGRPKDKDVIVNLQAVTEAFAQRPKWLHLRQDMFHADTYAGQPPIHQLVVFTQGMLTSLLVAMATRWWG